MRLQKNDKDIITIFFALICFIYVLHAININNTKINVLFYFIFLVVLFIILNISKLRLLKTKNTITNFLSFASSRVGKIEKNVVNMTTVLVVFSLLQFLLNIYKDYKKFTSKNDKNPYERKKFWDLFKYVLKNLGSILFILSILLNVYLNINFTEIVTDESASLATSIYNKSNLNSSSETSSSTFDYKSILDSLENNTVFLFIIFVVLLFSSTELLFMFVENWYSSNGYKNIGKNLKIICYNNFTTRYNNNILIKHLFFGLFVFFYFYILSSKTFNNTPIGFPLVTLFVFIIVFYTTTLKTSKLDKEYYISYYKDLKEKKIIDIVEKNKKNKLLGRFFNIFGNVIDVKELFEKIIDSNLFKVVFTVLCGIFFIVLSKITGENYTEMRQKIIKRCTNGATIYLYGLIFFQIIICILGLPTKLLFMGFVYVMSIGYLTKDTDIKSQEMINYELRVKEINKKLKYNKIILCIMVILSFITTIYINRNYLGALIDKLKKRQKKLAEGSKCG